MEERLQFLLRRLALLGYHDYEIDNIVKSASASCAERVERLEHFEHLGQQYLHNYNK